MNESQRVFLLEAPTCIMLIMSVKSSMMSLLEDRALEAIIDGLKKQYKKPYPFTTLNGTAKQPRKCNWHLHPKGVSKTIKKGEKYFGKKGLSAGTYGSPYTTRKCKVCVERGDWLATHNILNSTVPTHKPLIKKVEAFLEKNKK